jgi:hypothetical protein
MTSKLPLKKTFPRKFSNHVFQICDPNQKVQGKEPMLHY